MGGGSGGSVNEVGLGKCILRKSHSCNPEGQDLLMTEKGRVMRRATYVSVEDTWEIVRGEFLYQWACHQWGRKQLLLPENEEAGFVLQVTEVIFMSTRRMVLHFPASQLPTLRLIVRMLNWIPSWGSLTCNYPIKSLPYKGILFSH